jgi:phosphoglycolate phosphatase
MLKLLIFDLDGTLANTAQDITDAINYALKPFGTKTYSVEETKTMVGSGISKLLESLIPSKINADPDTSIEKEKAGKIVTGRFLEFYSNHLLDNTVTYPGVKKTLEKLGEYTKAVLSNKREAYSCEIIEKLEIAHFFETIWGSDSVRKKKPSPAAVLDLLNRFNVSREETAIIGDSNFDIEAGRAAGIKTIGVTYGFRSRESLNGADYIIDSFEEILSVLPKLE